MNCVNCGTPWVRHAGPTLLCKDVERLRSALKVIHTWATFDGGATLNPEHVAKLAGEALKGGR